LKGCPALIVDDNSTNRRILEEVLRSWHMRPGVAESGPAALIQMKRAVAEGRPYRLVLLDCMMPDMDGFMLAERIRQDTGFDDPTLIMISSAPRSGDADRCREVGVARYLTKPIVQSELLDTVAEVFGEPAAGELAETAGDVPRPGPTLKVLLAEDSPINRRVAMGFLQQRGYHVVAACDGKEAVDAFQREPFDVVLMDVQMPVMDGYEATAMIRDREKASGRHTPIVAMTAAAMKGDRDKCLPAGMDDYIAKPIDPDNLYDKLDSYSQRLPHSAADTTAGRIHESPEERSAAQADETTAGKDESMVNPTDILDLDEAAERIPGGPEELKELAQLLVEETSQRLQKMRDALASGDVATVGLEAHPIKSAAAVFGANAVVEAAQRVESMGREGKLEEVKAGFAELEEQAARLHAALRSVVGGDPA